MTIDEIEDAIKSLPLTDRTVLLDRLVIADEFHPTFSSLSLRKRIDVLEAGISNLPPEGRISVLEHFRPRAMVYIYDQEADNLFWPCAMIIYNNKCEHINIIASVRNNADSIRHPAISLAIRRWSNCITAQFALARGQSRTARASWEMTKGTFFKKAQGHIRNIGRALRDAPESQQKMKAPIAFASIIKRIDENVAPYLRVCWRVLKLHKNEITTGENEEGDRYDRNTLEKCRVLKVKVLEYFREHGLEGWSANIEINENIVRTLEPGFDMIIEFFESSEGEAFFYNANRFDVLLSTYAQKATGLSADTISDYRRMRNKANPSKLAERRFLMPEVSETNARFYDPASGRIITIPTTLGENYYHTSELDDCFSLPTVSCSSPKCVHHTHPRYKK